MALAALAIVLHLVRGRDPEQIAYSMLLVVVLVSSRREFTVQSGAPRLRRALLRLGITTGLALAYGVAGFWLLDVRDFGVNFILRDAVRNTVSVLLLRQDLGVAPLTVHARWFLDSLDLMTLTVVAYAASQLFRPVAYRMFVLPNVRRVAQAIVERHGRSSLDYFKPWTDKSIFLSRSQAAFLAYRVGRGYAMVLGDPVGPEAEREALADEFIQWCHENDWGAAFHQVPRESLSMYRRLGLRSLRIGDEAVVDLDRFSLAGKSMKRLRNTVHKLTAEGARVVRFEPPIADHVLREAHEVSAEWLTLPGRRERRFTLGRFDPDYLRATPLVAVVDPGGHMLAFVNLIPSFVPGEATIDLMRHRPHAASGSMDLLFIELFRQCRERGFARFSLGMAPLGGFGEREPSTPEERGVRLFIGQVRSRFSFEGMRQFKGKYATHWEPRYLAYRTVLSLPRIALALNDVSEFGRRGLDD